jgi:hypothetical protein
MLMGVTIVRYMIPKRDPVTRIHRTFEVVIGGARVVTFFENRKCRWNKISRIWCKQKNCFYPNNTVSEKSGCASAAMGRNNKFNHV